LAGDGGIVVGHYPIECIVNDAGENHAPTPVVAGGGYVARRYLIECIAIATCIYSLVLLRGALDLGLPDRMIAALPSSFYLCRHRIGPQMLDVWRILVDWYPSTTLLALGLDAMVTAEYRRRVRDDVCVHECGPVRNHS
jgi:hypothetical protein